MTQTKFTQPCTAVKPVNSASNSPFNKQWQEVPKSWETCVHHVIQDRCRESPESLAVLAWDGSLTYRELDDLSSNLASVLTLLGVKSETIVPICMEKSFYTTVAMLGIMKSGATFALLDPSYPSRRLHTICQDLSCSLILTCRGRSKHCSQLANVLIVDALTEAWQFNQHQYHPPSVTPNNALYVAFTSGSTGKPKGVVIEHRSYCSGARAHLEAFGIDNKSRVLQFAAYAFDVSIMESLSTLMAGACLCILSEGQRTDATLFIEAVSGFRITHAFLTPSFARTVSWRHIPTASTLILGGEKMRPSDAVSYEALNIRLMNAYGPAECAVNATVQPLVLPGCDVSDIGYPTGAVVWIVNPDNPHELMPPDTVGELLIEGPIVGRGYLNNAEATRKVFIDAPVWLQALRGETARHRVYRTGDLASKSAIGVLTICGRKDGQIKIRGQRVELGDIEHHVHQHLSSAIEVIVEKISPADGQESLVAFVLLRSLNGEEGEEGEEGKEKRDRTLKDGPLFLTPRASLMDKFGAVQHQLQERLPRYMIPYVFIPLATIPRTASGKVDRAVLRTAAAALSRTAMQAFASSATSKRHPATEVERKLQQLYAEVLDVPAELIGMDDNFLHLGGNSIMAIRLVSAARKEGLLIYGQDLLSKVSISSQAEKATMSTPPTVEVHVPFGMLRADLLTDTLRIAQDQCGVQRDQIEDIYQCTALQEGMFALSLKHPGMYKGKVVFQIPDDVDLARLKIAWQKTAAANPILRTRIIQTSQGLLQVVVVDQFKWQEDHGLKTPPKGEDELTTYLGEPLVQFTYHGQSRELILTIHHSAWDDWSLRVVHHQVEAAYQGVLPQTQLYQPFIQYTERLQGADAFWSSELGGLEAPIFPDIPSSSYQPSPTSVAQHVIESLARADGTGHTIATHIHLAWAMLVAHYTDSEEVLYGITVSGRNAPCPGIEQLVGPTIATVPLRIQVEPKSPVWTNLDRIQAALTRMIPFEQAGLQRIAKCNADASKACGFSTQLIIQSEGDNCDGHIFPVARGSTHSGMNYTAFANCAMMLVFRTDKSTVTIDATYDPNVISAGEVGRMAYQFEHFLRQILQQSTRTIGSIQMASPQDVHRLQQWNSAMPPADARCLHDLVLAQYKSRPQAIAVCAWDGSLTYAELISLSSSFAHQLSALGVVLGSFVSICLEKSKWSTVAIMAVLRVGATCILLDAQHPRQRMHDMIQHTSTKVMIHSAATATVTGSLCQTEVLVSTEFTDRLHNQSYSWQQAVSAEVPAFIMFTSGSTGRPKGIVMPHRTLSTSICYHSAGMNVDSESRVLHFSSYAFDVSIYEIFTTWAAGGTVCVPSEFERKNDLAGFIQRFRVNWAFMTPSAVQMLHPAEVPSLSTLVLGGEAVTRDHVDTWADESRTLINGYGPAEATICGVGRMLKQSWKSGVVGHIVGGLGWITMPSDPSRLAAVGAVGELLLEGPFLAQGYLKLPDVTAAAFIECPGWRHQMALLPGVSPRLYRTGDLVQYQDDGSIRYIGRRDTRIKLRGQLVDLGEVETNVLRVFPAAMEVVAEVIVLAATPSTAAILVAFVKLAQMKRTEEERTDGGVLAGAQSDFRDTATRAQALLRALLPTYMVPLMIVPLYEVPKTLTGKVDRGRLRTALQSLPRPQLQSYLIAPRVKQPISTDAERQLQEIWAGLLQMPCKDIGADDSFLTIGGDSVAAMRMVAMARRAGFGFTVPDVLDGGTLSSLARNQQEITSIPTQVHPHSSVLATSGFQSRLTQLRQDGVLPPKCLVVSASPTTQAQAFLIKTYPWSHFSFVFKGRIDREQLRAACAVLMEAHSILRTAFITLEKQLVQLVLTNVDIPFHLLTTDKPLGSFYASLCSREQDSPVTAAGLPTRFTLVSNILGEEHIFMLRLSHAQYDANSIPKMVDDLETVFNARGSIVPNHFEQYCDQRRQHEVQLTYAFWNEYLNGSSMCPLPSFGLATPALQVPETPVVISESCSLELPLLPSTVTLPSFVKAAACLVLARLTGNSDVVVGQTVDGRSLPFAGIDRVIGPCINYVPFRVTLRPGMTALDYILHAHNQHTRSLGHESLDLDSIIQHSTTWAPSTNFTYIVQHQTADNNIDLDLAGNKSLSFFSSGRLHPSSEIWICSTVSPSAVQIDIMTSSLTLTQEAARMLAHDICTAMGDLLRGMNKTLAFLDGLKR